MLAKEGTVVSRLKLLMVLEKFRNLSFMKYTFSRVIGLCGDRMTNGRGGGGFKAWILETIIIRSIPCPDRTDFELNNEPAMLKSYVTQKGRRTHLAVT